MLKHIALVAILSLGIGIPVVAAQGTPDGPGGPGPLQKIMRLARLRIERGVRAGRITPAELARLRADAAAVRTRIQALRQTGAPPTPADRQEIRQALRRLNREIFVANHNRIRTGR
jgi:hypothetical protein